MISCSIDLSMSLGKSAAGNQAAVQSLWDSQGLQLYQETEVTGLASQDLLPKARDLFEEIL